MSTPSLGTMPINLGVLLETRMLVQANAGGGKSWALRRLLEQTAGQVQQIVLDPEGEFATLRERFDYIICAPSGADAVATPPTAAALARALWKAGTSAVVDIYELKAHERILFVRRFLEALVSAPRSMWHPTLVVLDEAHMFAPQVGSAESLGAVVDLASRGRKRGLSLVAATQRLSKLHKDCAAELLNKLVGRTGLDVDVQRAGDELGMSRKDATEQLRILDPGEFFAYGPALSRVVVRTRIGAVETTHPRTGHRELIAPPPASPTVLAQLAKLEGIQREVATEAKTVEALTAEVTALRRKLTIAEKAQPGANEAEVRRRIAEAVAAVPKADPVVLQIMGEALGTAHAAAKRIVDAVDAARAHQASRSTVSFKAAMAESAGRAATSPPAVVVEPRLNRAPPPRVAAAQNGAGNDSLSGPEQRILDAIAWLETIGVDAPEQPAVAFLAGYKFGGGAFNNPKGRLNQRELVEYLPNRTIRLTDSGRRLANAPEAAGSNEELHERVLARLGGPEQRLLRPLLAAYPAPMSNADLASASGYAAGAGAFNNPKGRLRGLGLVDYPQPGHVVARSLLFPRSAP